MKSLSRLLAVACVALLFSVTAAAGSEQGGDGKPLYTMAKILINLNHFPSDEEKARLAAIVASEEASAEEKALAQAIHDMQHAVSADHREKLQAIADGDGDEHTRKLAGVLLGINHKPGDEAMAELKAIKAAAK